MYKVYSYIETAGKSFVPPEIKGEKSDLPLYLAVMNGRHYISVSGKIPVQAPEIDCRGPIDLKAKENKELAAFLTNNAQPVKEVRTARRVSYPDILDQVGAIIAEFAKRAEAGEKLSAELLSIIDRVSDIKKKNPKNNKEIGL